MGLLMILAALVMYTAGSSVLGFHAESCKEIKAAYSTAPSGKYHIQSGTSNIIEVYCEMGLNGGGYTFLSPKSLADVTDADLQSLITDRSSLLMRIRRCDGTQPYTVLQQLPQYAHIPIAFNLNNITGYKMPLNLAPMGSPYLYTGFLPNSVAASKTVQGLRANGVIRQFTNCDANGNSYVVLFPNFEEKPPTTYALGYDYPFCNAIFDGAIQTPSTRVMPPEYFMFAEFHFGGCGCYTQSDARLRNKCILGFHIGFR